MDVGSYSLEHGAVAGDGNRRHEGQPEARMTLCIASEFHKHLFSVHCASCFARSLHPGPHSGGQVPVTESNVGGANQAHFACMNR